ncbi:hypothetical protein B0T16DRAFT_454864 [Cercophora newfieldiana]|uniref:Uncharacterized protein n=1 Tax=Cercophora newfieldiana TaxID=92897 RepID=A0AA39YH29_9PEZI|nr:hypothetical protein B0T16DRAFT_454864 [Cercophora newfieldiana]
MANNVILLDNIRIDPVLDIRNSAGAIHSKPQQDLWYRGLNTNDDDPSGKYKGSLFPASSYGGTVGGAVQLFLQFALPANVYITSDTDMTLTLEESSGTLRLTAIQYDATGRMQASIRPSYAKDGFPWGFAGDVTWTLTVGGTPSYSCWQITRLEVYSLPGALPAFYHGCVHVKFLRAFVLDARPESPEDTWTSYVTRAAFSKFGFCYDIFYGRPKYAGGGEGGPFDLHRWVRGINKHNMVNCYDQAGIVQIANALGPPTVKTKWVFMKPFGYIKTTHLVGYPDNPCNSPFGRVAEKLLVGNDDENRTGFGNHAFVKVINDNGKATILDACAGPQVGTLTFEEYIANTIQPAGAQSPGGTSCYSHAHEGISRPGELKDAAEAFGTAALDYSDISLYNPDPT